MSAQRSAVLTWTLRFAGALFLGAWILVGWRLIEPPVDIPLPPRIERDMVLCSSGRVEHAGPGGSAEIPAFWIDRFEVTGNDYAGWLKVWPQWADVSRGLTPEQLAVKPDQPVTRVTITEAKAFAAASGKRLPSLVEWEWAATGPGNRRYPWGDAEPLVVPANVSDAGLFALAPVGIFESGRSEFGAYDLAGNAAEWTASAWDGIFNTRYFTKGGSFLDPLRDRASGVSALDSFRPEEQSWQPVETRLLPEGTWSSDIGFRCALDACVVEEEEELRAAASSLGVRDPWGHVFEFRPAVARLRARGLRALPYLDAALAASDPRVAAVARQIGNEIRESLRR